MPRSTIFHVDLVAPKPVAESHTDGYSWLLNAFTAHTDRVVLSFGAEGTNKHESLGRLYSDLRPRQGGMFRVELGAILSDRLPAVGEFEDYVLQVRLDEVEEPRFLCFSNQMMRLRYCDADGEMVTGMVPLARAAQAMTDAKIPAGAHLEYLRTVVTAQYDLAGDDAEDALAAHLEPAIDDFIRRINRVLAAQLMVAPLDTGILTPSYDRGSFESLRLLIAGNEERLQGNVLGLSVFRVALVVKRCDVGSTERVRRVAGHLEPVDDVAQLLRAAKGYLDGGQLEFALLQLAIAAEIATTRFVHHEYERRGVSKTKLERFRTDLTFSILLNVELMALAPESAKPDRDVIGAVDRVRDLRNKLMHYGQFETTSAELRTLHGSVQKHVEYLRYLATGG
jgi:hypothetical protein